MEDCLFCKIAGGEIPSKKVYEDDQVLAFYDIDTEAPTLFLVILTEQCLARNNRIPALVGAAATVAALVCFGPEQMLVPASLAIIGVLLLLRRKLEPQEVQP